MSRVHDPNLATEDGLEFRLGQQSKSARATAPVAAKRVVVAGTQGVTLAATNANAVLAIGITESAAERAGQTVRLAFQGAVDDVPAQGTIAAGALLIRSGTSAGHVAASATPAAGTAIGFALADSAGGVVPVYLYGR